MNIRSITLALASALTLVAAPAVLAQDGGDFQRFSVAGTYNIVKPKSDALNSAGNGVSGSSAPALSAAVFVTPNIAVEGWGVIGKSEHKIGGGGHVDAKPYALSAQYHFGQPNQPIRPYVGLGYHQVEFADEVAASGTHFDLQTAKGAVGTLGADFNINPRFFARAEARYLHGNTDLRINGSDAGEAKVSPWVMGVGVGARF